MKTCKLSQVKRGEFFQLVKGGAFYVRGEYDRSEKKYEFTKFDDVSVSRMKKGDVRVIVGADF
jgi:hypothetical protein